MSNNCGAEDGAGCVCGMCEKPKAHIRFKITRYRDVNRDNYIQITAQCECGAGGFLRLPAARLLAVAEGATDICPLCGASPMTVNCNNGNCIT